MKVIVLAILLISNQSLATVSCYKTVTGTTHCSGIDKSGKVVSTESIKTITGTTYTSGKDGSESVNRQCYTTVTGTTYCE
ncbi:hypothetical protein FZI02_20840 [Cronobacter sakazakii]|nr:hypothetical protein [Cronobacter sakazakii]KAB0835353.1 hypothetical protein FZI02_20840 [Cronobacter sakazakii]KAB0837807.1 hypothetical protein FZI45_19850 [Cronobacter sakazakii]